MRRYIATSLLFFVAVASAPGVASAQDKRKQAEKFFRAGEKAYEAGQYRLAAQAFEEAYSKLPVAAIAFSTAQAYRLQHVADGSAPALKRSIELYRLYLKEDPNGKRVKDAVTILAELEPQLARLEAAQSREGKGPIASRPAVSDKSELMVSASVDGAMAAVDGDKARAVPFSEEVTAGTYTVKVTADGYFPLTIKRQVVAGQRVSLIEAVLKPKPALLSVKSNDGAEVSVDGRPAGTVPLSRPVRLDPGTYYVTVTQRGHKPFAREVALERGQALDLEAPVSRTWQRKGSYVVLGVATLVYVGAGVAALGALSEQSKAQDIDDKRNSGGGITAAELDAYNSHKSRRDDLTRVSLISLGVGTAFAAGGLLMYFLDNPRPDAPEIRPATDTDKPKDDGPTFSAMPAIGPDYAGVAMGATF